MADNSEKRANASRRSPTRKRSGAKEKESPSGQVSAADGSQKSLKRGSKSRSKKVEVEAKKESTTKEKKTPQKKSSKESVRKEVVLPPRKVDVYIENQVIIPEVLQQRHVKPSISPNTPQLRLASARSEVHRVDPLEVEAVHNQVKRCVHSWPTKADLAEHKAVDKSKKPWARDLGNNILDIDFYFGRCPLWYVEEKLIKYPGEFLITRAHDNRPRVSVMTKEKGNPVATFMIEFEQTSLTKNDRNYYYRIVGTTLQCNTLCGLMLMYRETPSLLHAQTKRKAELLFPVIPCQHCIYNKFEYSFRPIHIRHFSDLVPGEIIRIGRDAKVLKGVRTVTNRFDAPHTSTDHHVVIKEFTEYSADVLDAIYLEMHIVQTIRFKIGWDTVVNVEGVYAFKKPYTLLYTYCDGNSWLEYSKKKPHTEAQKIAILLDLATTIYHMHCLNIIHCDIQPRNVFIDTSGPTYLFGGLHLAAMDKKKQVYRKVNKDLPLAPRYTSPDVCLTGVLYDKTDVYAFGMLIYEFLSGERPFHAIPDEEIWKKLQQQPGMRPAVLNYPSAIKDLMESCWHSNPDKRPSMDKVCLALKGFGKKADQCEQTQCKTGTLDSNIF